jgi:hypothetical protein
MESHQSKLKVFNRRYIENKFSGLDMSANMVDLEIIPELKIKLKQSLENYLKNSDYQQPFVRDSQGNKEDNLSLYSGTGSHIYMFWRYFLLCKNKNFDDSSLAKAYLNQSLQNNLNLISQIQGRKRCPSFFMSCIGFYTLTAIFYCIENNQQDFQSCLEYILKYKFVACSDSAEYELLYGTAGYLYSLFLIKKHCEIFLSESFKELNTVILDVVRHLHKEGLRNMKNFKADFLIWPWPKKSTKKLSEVYLGAAHGVIGVLYMMIQSLVSLGVNNSQKSNEDEFFEIISNIKNTLDNLALLRFASGNFPSSLNNERDQLVHFCHGETGAIPLYLLAYEFFKNNYYLEIALKSGEDLWERGILLKGNGLCHGISGGAYSLFSIYKKTQDTTWRTRAFLFAMATFDEDVQELCRNYKDPQRLSKGIPDSPYSLMEGEAGTISLYSDLLNEDEYVIFPGYEI